MKKFLFITHLSPLAIRSKLRQDLIDCMFASLQKQTNTNWKALWIGENEYQDEKIKEVAVTNYSDLATIYLREDVLNYINDCDYIIKLDDDDIILPHTLQIVSNLNFDCYADEYHTFYDISSGVQTQQKRPWIAATCIHKKEHAMMHQNGLEKADNFIHSLFYGEHGNDWINYYKDKNIIYANKNTPVYVRVLSPSSITAGAKIFPVLSFNDVDMESYYTYLNSFGIWNKSKVLNFDGFKERLNQTWQSFSNQTQQPIKKIKTTDKIKYHIKNILHIK